MKLYVILGSVFQVDMTVSYQFRQVWLQGREDVAMWVTSYSVYYSDSPLDADFQLYTDNNSVSVS